jgi:hypothetical protein
LLWVSFAWYWWYTHAQMYVLTRVPCRRFSMRRSQEPRTAYRFGFHAHEEREGVMQQEATVDDILESLGRRTQLADTLSMREARDPTEEGEDLFDSRVVSLPQGSRASPFVVRGSLGTYAFSLMLVGGVVILLLYGFLSSVLGASSPSVGAGRSLLGLILDDPVKLGFLGVLCLVPVVIAMKRRGRLERLPVP